MKHQNKNLDSLFPVNLILKKKKCIIIGGGKVSTRKAEKLISAGVHPTIISKAFSHTILEFHTQNLVSLIYGEFKESYLDDIFLVFIATNDSILNSQIAEICSKRSILSCAVDENWHKSAFITPASFAENGLTVSVSTGGKSCRYARLIKDNIKRYISAPGDSELFLIGTDHRFLNLAEREHLHVSIDNKDIPEMLSHVIGIHEFMIINTCNRVEILCLINSNENIEKMILKLSNFNLLDKKEYYTKRGLEAFKHLTLVTAGIYSQLIGENHISSQIKEAFASSEKNKWSGGILKSFIESAQFIAKQIRNSVSSIIKPTEIENLTIRYLKSIRGIDLKNDSIAVLGTGQIGTKLIEELLKLPIKNIIWFYHKSIPKTDGNANIQVVSLNELKLKICNCSIVISALRINKPLLTKEYCSSKGTTTIDLGMPRNISSDFSENIVDLEKLKYWYRKEICSVDTILPICEKIINYKIVNYEKISNSLKNWNTK